MAKLLRAEEDELLKLMAQGDVTAFSIFYDQHWEWIFNAAYKRVRDVEVAKDISQEIFSQIWIQFQSGMPPEIENLRGYLYVVVRNHVFKWLEKERKFISISDVFEQFSQHADTPDSQIIFEELLSDFRQLLDSLPPQQRIVFQLRYDEGKSNEEIAALLQITEKTVRNQLGRAVGKMKTRIVMLLLLMMAAG